MNFARVLLILAVTSFASRAKASENFIVADSFGVLYYEYNFDLPSARGRYQPSLISRLGGENGVNNPDSYTWAIPTPGISYEVVNGIPQTTYSDGRQASKLLVPSPRDGANHFNVDVETGYMDFWPVDPTSPGGPALSTWDARDSFGNTYTFTGAGTCPTGATSCAYRLTQVVDPDGNPTLYTYGSWGLESIQYNAYNVPPAASTAQKSVSGPFATIATIEYGIIIPNTTYWGITNIRVKNQGASGLLTVRRFALGYLLWTGYYHQVQNYTTVLTQTITEIGGESGASRAPTVFEYSTDLRLKAVTSPLGARREIKWSSSSAFGDSTQDAFPVLTEIDTTGPGLTASAVRYAYRGPTAKTTCWVGGTQIARENRGFPESWTLDVTTQIVKHTWWEVASHAFIGSAARVEYGSLVYPTISLPFISPITYNTFSYDAYGNVARSVSAPGTPGVCTTLTGTPTTAVEVPATSYPVIGFPQSAQHATIIGGAALSSTRSIACGDVDPWGNVGRVSVDPDTNFTADEYVESSTFEVGFQPAAICKHCVREATRTDPAFNQLEATYYQYDSTYRFYARFRKVDSANNTPGSQSYPIVESWRYNADGTLYSHVQDGVPTSYTYDTYQLRAWSQSVGDGTGWATLETDTTYDDYGRVSSVTGPYVVGSTDLRPQTFFAYDALGRTRLITRQPISGSVISQAVQAFEYLDFSGITPAAVKTYDFAVPLGFTSQWTQGSSIDPGIPQTSDVRQTIWYLDAFGREVQVRQRLGGTLPGDPGAHILQTLSQYRVAKATILDGAGRETASLEPYYSGTASYKDLSGGLDSISSPVHVTLTTYDAQGRIACQVVRYASTTIPAAGSCASSFGEDGNYARAALTSYRGVIVAGQTYLGVKTIPPENNVPSSMVGPESFYDSSGRLRWSTDAAGNKTTLTYDLIGRQTGTVREVSANSSGRPTTIATTFVPDMMGRIASRTDPNIGARVFIYDQVSPSLLSKLQFVKNGDEIRYTYDKGRIHTISQCHGPSSNVTCPTLPDATFTYDLPYSTPGATYAYTAGRLAWATNQNTTIAFGYDQNGAILRRDQWLPGIDTVFSSLETTTLDGRSVQSDFVGPGSNLTYTTWYDSAANPVQVAAGAITHWSTDGSGPTGGAFDPIGRLASARRDSGLVQETWSYNAYSGLPLGQSASLPSGLAYQVGQMSWQGAKLAGYTDNVGQTNYQYWYAKTGELAAAKATPVGSSPLVQNSLVCLSYNVTKKYGPGPSFGNIERTREGATAPFTQDFSYTGTDVGSSTLPPPPHLGGPDAATSVGAATLGYDDYGRVVSVGGTSQQFAYDLLGRMTSITRPDGTSETLSYDPFGALVSRQLGTTVVSYIGRRSTVTGTLATGCQTAPCGIKKNTLQVDVHVTVAGRRMASVRTGSGAQPRTLYYYRDRLGSVVATTLGGGMPGANYRYSAHGTLEVASGDSGDTASELGYTGALRLSGGLVVMGARIYNPLLRIFMQPDPLQPFSYTYAGADPVNRFDPTGMGDTAVPAGVPFDPGGYWNHLNTEFALVDSFTLEVDHMYVRTDAGGEIQEINQWTATYGPYAGAAFDFGRAQGGPKLGGGSLVFGSSWKGHAENAAMLQRGYERLKASKSANAWFQKYRRIDPFSKTVTVEYHSWYTPSLSDWYARYKTFSSYTSVTSDTIVFLPSAFSSKHPVALERYLMALMMHELSHIAQSSSERANNPRDDWEEGGAYESEATAYRIFDGKSD